MDDTHPTPHFNDTDMAQPQHLATSAAASATDPGPSAKPGLINTIRNMLHLPRNVKRSADRPAVVAALIKRIEKVRGKEAGLVEMERLDRAIAHPDISSACVTIPRSQDGRIQVGYCKDFPHVIACRLWRWSDLQRHNELRPMPHCIYHYEAKHAEVCINPTHYRRVETTAVMVRKPQQQQQPPQQQPQQQQLNRKSPETDTDSGVYSEPNSPGAVYVLPAEGGAMLAVANLNYGAHTVAYEQPPTYEAVGLSSRTVTVEPVPYEEAIHWASIRYFELNVHVGDVFHCFRTDITIDGYTYPQNNGDRFCLGQLSNINRNTTIEKVRQHIGCGLQLQFVNGELHARNNTKSAVFVHSHTVNHESGVDAAAVSKILPDATMLVFNNAVFTKILADAVQHGFEVVYGLTKMCTVRMSFAKGWGDKYQRPDVTATPCWIEVHMNGALKWLDNVLTMMGPPTVVATSVS